MLNAIKKIISLLLVFLVLRISAITKGDSDVNTQTVAKNIEQGILNGTVGTFSGPDIWDAEDIISRIEPDSDSNYYFRDIDYSNPERSTWPAARHITRTERLAIVYRLEENEEKKQEYLQYILGLLDHWISMDYMNSNWWHNKLSNPNILGEIGILMKDDLGGDRLTKLAELVGRGCYTVDPTIYAYTGANRIDLAMSSIKFGALTGSRTAIRAAVNAAANELKYSSSEGFKKDGTFFQHGNRLYMGGYGITFINGMTYIIDILSGTDYIFTREQMEPFANFLLEGLKMMSFGDTLDPTTMGRSVSRVNAQPLRGIVPQLNKLADVEEMPGADEIREYAALISNNVKSDYGVKYYDEAKFIVINNSDFYFSFRGGDKKTVYSEIINSENVLSYNSSFPGVTTIMHTGNEYVNISPVFDYSLVPGTTAVYETDEQLASHGDFSYRTLNGTYAGASAENAAVSGAKTVHEGISMTVSCFATDNAAVLLGAGMKDSKGREMNTAIDQSFYTGSFERNGNTVIHNGIKYTVLDGGELTAGNVHRTGNWKRNNIPLSDAPVEGDLFTVSLKNKGEYAYSVMSENTEAEFEIIENSEKLQAVRLPDGRVAAVFFANGEFTFDGTKYSGKKGEAGIF